MAFRYKESMKSDTLNFFTVLTALYDYEKLILWKNRSYFNEIDAHIVDIYIAKLIIQWKIFKKYIL